MALHVFLLDDHGLVRYSLRQRKVSMGIADGPPNRQIDDQRFLAEEAVKNHVSSLVSKLGIEPRTKSAVYAASLDDQRRRDRGRA